MRRPLILSIVGVPALAGLLIAGCEQQAIVETPQIQVAPAVKKRQRVGIAAGEDSTKITFDDLDLGLKGDDVVTNEMLSARATQLTGERVSITGVMYGGIGVNDKQMFVLTRNKGVSFKPGFRADQFVQVYLRPGETFDYTTETVRVAGILHIEPQIGDDGNTWSLYILKEATAAKAP